MEITNRFVKITLSLWGKAELKIMRVFFRMILRYLFLIYQQTHIWAVIRAVSAHDNTIISVATVSEKPLENEYFSRSGKNQGILWMVREIWKVWEKSGNLKINGFCGLQELYLFC